MYGHVKVPGPTLGHPTPRPSPLRITPPLLWGRGVQKNTFQRDVCILTQICTGLQVPSSTIFQVFLVFGPNLTRF